LQAGEPVGGQREHLKDVPVKHDEILVDQGISSEEGVIKGALEQRTNLIEAVVGQAVSVSHEDQKDIQQELMLAEAAPEALASAAMLEEREAAGNLADALGTQGTLFNHDAPPCP
jgi:hypothetical protein